MKVEGVLRVITAHDIPQNASFGARAKKSQLILAEKEVRYVGEPIALIVAESQDALEKAKDLLVIDWKPAPLPQEEEVRSVKFELGKASNAEDLQLVETTFEFPSLQARYLEAESGWVEFKEKDESFNFHIGALLSESQRMWLSQVLGVSHEKLQAKESHLGGQFGGRQQRELIAFLAIAAHLTRRSVRLHLHQETQDIGSYGYAGKLGIRYDPESHRLVELRGELRLDVGSYEGNAELALQKALEHVAGIYKFRYVGLEGKIILTPTHPRRALKGEGLTAVTWVTEQLVEEIAKKLEVKPLELRIENQREDFSGLDQVLEQVERYERPFELVPIDRNRPLWDEKFIAGRGYGFQMFQPTTLKEFDYSEVSIDLQPSGSFVIRTSNLTLDLRVKSALCEIAATVLKTHPKAFTVEGKMRLDFDKPARRETYPEFYYMAQATWHAAQLLKERLIAAGQKVLGTPHVILKDGAVADQQANRKMGYRELGFTHSLHDLKASYILKGAERPHGCAAGAVSRVSFHPLTGEVRVESVKVILDAGPVLYGKGLEIEVDSAVSWAMATLFSSGNREEQPIPTPLDGPEEVTVLPIEYKVQDYSEEQPELFGARGIADVVMSAVLASLVNAIHDAKGVVLDKIPMSLEFMYPNRRKSTVHTLNFKRNQ